MSVLTRILKLVFSLYALLAFVATFFITFPAYFIIFNIFSKQKAPHVAHSLSRLWARVLLVLFLIRVKVQNRSYINPEDTYVFVSNHQSQLDILIAAVSSFNTFRFLAKAELTKLPVLGYIIRNLYVPVERKSKAERSRSVDNLRRSLDEGISVYIYPEGTRNKTDKPLLDFYDGAFRLALETGTPVAVLTIQDSKRLLNPLRLMDLSPGIIHCVWDVPIPIRGMTSANLESLKTQVRNLMQERLSEFSSKKRIS
jgi:1-acyl-sn-glycerol-3-phosphate acyltransferase